MNIRKIIDKEKWKTHLYDSDDRSSTNECHNASLERIEDAVKKRIAELEETINQLSKADASLRAQNEAQGRNAVASAKRIAELEKQLEPATIQEMYELEVIKDLHPKQINEVLVGMVKQIAELEAQVPKVVAPRFTGTISYLASCSCGNKVLISARYCSNCGSKLNWEDARC